VDCGEPLCDERERQLQYEPGVDDTGALEHVSERVVFGQLVVTVGVVFAHGWLAAGAPARQSTRSPARGVAVVRQFVV
jgi:hypothetical protein